MVSASILIYLICYIRIHGTNKKPLKTLMSKVVSTHLWNTPLNLYQQAIKGFLSKRAGGIAWGVLCGSVVIFLDYDIYHAGKCHKFSS